jgi:plasmid stabilization system protein ParE
VSGYRAAPESNNDIFEIWSWIAKDNVEPADQVDGELREVFEGLARMPGQGHPRKDPHVLRTRNVKRVLKQRCCVGQRGSLAVLRVLISGVCYRSIPIHSANL